MPFEFNNLPPVRMGKLIPRNFGHIKHLSGSKMIDNEDVLIDKQVEEYLTVKKNNPNDLVIVTEKIDGMNAGVVKKDGLIYPINRKGYDTRLMGRVHEELGVLGDGWAKWVDDHYAMYDFILDEGERLVYEYAEFTHTLEYKFKHEPVFLLAKYTADNKRVNYHTLCEFAKEYGFEQPPLLNIGVAVPPQLVLNQYPKGLVGVKGKIEGVVYNYEHNDQHAVCAKFVSNPLMGTINPGISPFRKNAFSHVNILN